MSKRQIFKADRKRPLYATLTQSYSHYSVLAARHYMRQQRRQSFTNRFFSNLDAPRNNLQHVPKENLPHGLQQPV
jgi:hypothetical protein